MRIDPDVKLDFSDVLIRPKRSELKSRADVNLHRTFKFKYAHYDWNTIPIIAANMDGVGTLPMSQTFFELDSGSVALTKHYSKEELLTISPELNEFVWYSLGLRQEDFDKFAQFYQTVSEQHSSQSTNPLKLKVCLDVANGYTQTFIQLISKFRETYPEITIMAGNVATPEQTEEIILNGADIVKIGLGGGSVCTTRIKTGVGYPQLSAVIECADAAHGVGGLVCSDGGCRNSGDVAKAFGAGADFVMLGGMLSGTTQSGLEVVDGLLNFYGMSSSHAQAIHGDVKDYRASEGKVVKVQYRGDAKPIIKDILGGLRSACTYVGAQNIKELTKRTTFVRVSHQANDLFGS